MRAGRLDKLITVQRATVTRAPSGDLVETWAALEQGWAAEMRVLSGEERFVADQFVARQQVEFRFRWSDSLDDLSPEDRIVYPALEGSPLPTPEKQDVYEIMSVELLGRNEGWRVQAARYQEG